MNSHAADIHDRVSTLKSRMASKRMAAGALFSEIREGHSGDSSGKSSREAGRKNTAQHSDDSNAY